VKDAGLNFPRHRVVVNLAPTAVRKEGPAYDLPIALGGMDHAKNLPPNLSEGLLQKPSKNRNERCFQAYVQKCSKTRPANDTQSSHGTFPEASVHTIPKEADQETEARWLRTVPPGQMGEND